MNTYTDEDRKELEQFLNNGEAAPEEKAEAAEAEVPTEENAPEGEPVDGEGGDDEGEESIVVRYGDEVLTPQEDADDAGAPAFVKELRRGYREQAKKIRELEAKLAEQGQAAPAPVPVVPDPGPMPRIDDPDIDYNPDVHAERLEQWYEGKRKFDEQKAQIEAQQKVAAEMRQKVDNAFTEQRERLRRGVPNYDLVEQKVVEKLTPTQQAALKAAALAGDAGALIYAMGSKPQILEKMAAVQDPALFLFELGKLSSAAKVEPIKRKPTATPVRDIKGGSADGMAGLVSKYDKAGPAERMKMRKENPQIHQAWLSR